MSASPLVVETGSGLADADSYAAIGEADQHWCDNWGGAIWASLSDDNKTQLLRSAARQLSCYRWCGVALSPEQGLDWPRSGGGVPITEVPQAVKTAQIQLALAMAGGGGNSGGGQVSSGPVAVDAISAPGGFSIKFANGGAGLDMSGGACGATVVSLDGETSNSTNTGTGAGGIDCLLAPYLRKSRGGPRVAGVCR